MFKLHSKRNNDDNLLILIAVLLLVLSIGVVFWLSGIKNQINYNTSRVLPLKIIGKAGLTIDFGNDRIRAFEGNIVEKETLIDVLNQAARAGDFSYKLSEKNDLASISELASGGRKSWYWYINGKKINKQPGGTIVKPDDNILIKYE